MIMGHYASALLPHSLDRQAPLALYLFLAICRAAHPAREGWA